MIYDSLANEWRREPRDEEPSVARLPERIALPVVAVLAALTWAALIWGVLLILPD